MATLLTIWSSLSIASPECIIATRSPFFKLRSPISVRSFSRLRPLQLISWNVDFRLPICQMPIADMLTADMPNADMLIADTLISDFCQNFLKLLRFLLLSSVDLLFLISFSYRLSTPDIAISDFAISLDCRMPIVPISRFSDSPISRFPIPLNSDCRFNLRRSFLLPNTWWSSDLCFCQSLCSGCLFISSYSYVVATSDAHCVLLSMTIT